MTYSPIIKQLCGISDKNITISELPDEETLDNLDYNPIMGTLTYKPKACDMCGVKNKSTQDIIKYGFKETGVQLPDGPGKPIKFTLKNNDLSVNTAKPLSLRNHQSLKDSNLFLYCRKIK